MSTRVLYQCQKCGRTLEIQEGEKLPPRKCSTGGKCKWKEPYYFE